MMPGERKDRTYTGLMLDQTLPECIEATVAEDPVAGADSRTGGNYRLH